MVEHAANKTNTIPFSYYIANLAASQTSVATAAAGEATAADCPQSPCPWNGSIVGMSVQCEDTATAGYAYVQPTINGTAAAAVLTLDATTNPMYDYTTWRRGLYPITAGERIGCIHTTTSAWAAGTTPSIHAIVFVHVESL